MTATLRVGPLTVTGVPDGVGLVADPAVLFSGGRGERSADWASHLPPSGTLEMPVGTFLVRSGERLVLVDAGYGPTRPDPVGGPDLLTTLAGLGVTAGDVTDVVFTHLHVDHVGWASIGGRPTFTRAVHRCHQADRVGLDTGADTPVARALRPVADRIETWAGEETIAPGVDVVPAPGHTPGTSVVVLSARGERAVLLGDVVHHPVQLVDDGWGRMADADPDAARRAVRTVLDELVTEATPVVGSHFPALAFGRVVPDTDRAAAGRRWVIA